MSSYKSKFLGKNNLVILTIFHLIFRPKLGNFYLAKYTNKHLKVIFDNFSLCFGKVAVLVYIFFQVDVLRKNIWNEKTRNRGQTGLTPFKISWMIINANQVFCDSHLVIEVDLKVFPEKETYDMIMNVIN